MIFVSGYIINADAVREDATVAYSAATGAPSGYGSTVTLKHPPL